MSVQDAFSHEEWSRIIQSPIMAGFAVTAADPDGLVGAVQEAGAVAGKIGKSDGADAPIVAAIRTSLQTAEGRGAAQAGVKELVKGRKPRRRPSRRSNRSWRPLQQNSRARRRLWQRICAASRKLSPRPRRRGGSLGLAASRSRTQNTRPWPRLTQRCPTPAPDRRCHDTSK